MLSAIILVSAVRAEDDFLEGLKRDKAAISSAKPSVAPSPAIQTSDPALPVSTSPAVAFDANMSEDEIFAALGPNSARLKDAWNNFAFAWTAVQLDVKGAGLKMGAVDPSSLSD